MISYVIFTLLITVSASAALCSRLLKYMQCGSLVLGNRKHFLFKKVFSSILFSNLYMEKQTSNLGVKKEFLKCFALLWKFWRISSVDLEPLHYQQESIPLCVEFSACEKHIVLHILNRQYIILSVECLTHIMTYVITINHYLWRMTINNLIL